jgi:hypothetical protein
MKRLTLHRTASSLYRFITSSAQLWHRRPTAVKKVSISNTAEVVFLFHLSTAKIYQ